jgi:hypothetical protein
MSIAEKPRQLIHLTKKLKKRETIQKQVQLQDEVPFRTLRHRSLRLCRQPNDDGPYLNYRLHFHGNGPSHGHLS